ncbi:MAG: manganese efflux pump MntP family protein [Thermodesulfovibrionales bacterium]|nr:manganese efflux pump MntP family protein [Thermodesulfovibrionales bacterium]
MDAFTILFIAVGLAMDTFAVSVASGIAVRPLRLSHVLRMAMSFGLFQAVMPIIGWSAGFGMRDFISGVDHWVAFGLLSIIGSKMIAESFSLKSKEKAAAPPGIYTLLILSIATSIDALAVGLTLSFLNVPILSPALIIGAVTFLLSLAGALLGRRFGHLLESKVEAGGGLILIGIGIKILIEHLDMM